MKHEIKEIPFSEINPAPYNPRVKLTASDPEYQDIRASLEEFGNVQLLVWNRATGNLVGGHQRMQVMQDEGDSSAMCCVVEIEDIHKEQQLNVALNGIAGKWDRGKLRSLLTDLEKRQYSIKQLGFRKPNLDEILGRKQKKTKRDPDQASIPPTNPVTKLGDLYCMTGEDGQNQHWLICGDSGDYETAERLTQGNKARICFTDPPYGISYIGNEFAKNKKIQNDQLTKKYLKDFLKKSFDVAYTYTMPKAAIYCFYASKNHIEFETALIDAGWKVRQQLLWIKLNQMTLNRNDYHWAHEPILYGGKRDSSIEWFVHRTDRTIYEMTDKEIEKLTKDDMLDLLKEMRAQMDVWDIKRDPRSEFVHPTQKPIALAQRAIRNSTLAGDWILELFAGSGSTLVAAEIERRNSMNFELDAAHCDAIVQRYRETFENTTITLNGEPIK